MERMVARFAERLKFNDISYKKQMEIADLSAVTFYKLRNGKPTTLGSVYKAYYGLKNYIDLHENELLEPPSTLEELAEDVDDLEYVRDNDMDEWLAEEDDLNLSEDEKDVYDLLNLRMSAIGSGAVKVECLKRDKGYKTILLLSTDDPEEDPVKICEEHGDFASISRELGEQIWAYKKVSNPLFQAYSMLKSFPLYDISWLHNEILIETDKHLIGIIVGENGRHVKLLQSVLGRNLQIRSRSNNNQQIRSIEDLTNRYDEIMEGKAIEEFTESQVSSPTVNAGQSEDLISEQTHYYGNLKVVISLYLNEDIEDGAEPGLDL